MDRRYTFRGCECGDAFCAGCDVSDYMPPPRDSEHAVRRWLHWDNRRNARAKGQQP